MSFDIGEPRAPSCPSCTEPPPLDQGVCPACGGRFVSGSELPAEARPLLEKGRPIQGARSLDCPDCGKPMQEVDCRGLLVDWCAACSGLWLDASEAAPGELSPLERALFAVSLPERALRGVIGSAAGAIHETASILLPSSVRKTRFFHSSVTKGLRFLIEDIAGVANRFEGTEGPQLDVTRAAIGGVIDNAGLIFLHVSPLWILAAVSDIAHGTKTYVRALQKELVLQGVIEEGTVVDGVDDLLERLEGVSGRLAESVDQPPLSIADLRGSLTKIRDELRIAPAEKLFPQAEVEATWNEMQQVAEEEDRSLFEVSNLVTLAGEGLGKIGRTAVASVTTGADLLYEGVLRHYRDTLGEIHENGYMATLRETVTPYLDAARDQLTTSQESFTERMLSGRFFKDLWKRWRPK